MPDAPVDSPERTTVRVGAVARPGPVVSMALAAMLAVVVVGPPALARISSADRPSAGGVAADVSEEPDESPSESVSETVSPPPTEPPTEPPSSPPESSPGGSPTVPTSAPPTPTSSPSASPTATPEASDSPTPLPTVTVRPGTTPAVSNSSIGWWSALLALAVLVAAGLILRVLARGGHLGRSSTPMVATEVAAPPEHLDGETSQGADASPTGGEAIVGVPAAPPATAPVTHEIAVRVQCLTALGEALIDTGDPVTHVTEMLEEVARAWELDPVEIVVLPTLLLVSVPGATTQTAVASAGHVKLRLDQVAAVFEVLDDGRDGRLEPADGLQRLASIRAAPPPFSPRARVAGYVVLTVGLALLLSASGLDVLVAAALGLGVGVVQQVALRLPPAYTVFVPVTCAFGVATAVFLLGRTNADLGVFAPLVAPLVTFLPGGLLTTSAIELATGQMISGAGRLAAGGMQLVLLAVGIVAGAQLVGVPPTTLDTVAPDPLGPIAPWIGVAVFGAGMVVQQCARPSSLGWILLVLYVAYAGQVIGGLFFGGVLSAFFGAMAMTPVALVAATQRRGPPALVSFLPAFWLLVPGALGLVGVTAFLGDDQLQGLSSLVTTVSTMVAIALGVLVGLAIGASATSVARRLGRA